MSRSGIVAALILLAGTIGLIALFYPHAGQLGGAVQVVVRQRHPVTETLSNGLRIAVLRESGLPRVHVMLSYDVGSGILDRAHAGTAHALEHMMFEGTTDVPAATLRRAIARVGGAMNAYTDEDETRYTLDGPSSDLQMLLHVEADRMMNATFAPDAWRMERRAIVSELDQRTPVQVLLARARRAAFAGPAGASPLGTSQGVGRLHVSGIRAAYERWYTPSNAILTVVGNVPPHVVFAEAQSLFTGAKHGARAPAIARPVLSASWVPPTVQQIMGERSQKDTLLDVAFAVPGAFDRRFVDSELLARVLAATPGPLTSLMTFGHVRSLRVIPDLDSAGGLIHVVVTVRRGESVSTVERIIVHNVRHVGSFALLDSTVAFARAALYHDFIVSEDDPDASAREIDRELRSRSHGSPSERIAAASKSALVHFIASDAVIPRAAVVIIGNKHPLAPQATLPERSEADATLIHGTSPVQRPPAWIWPRAGAVASSAIFDHASFVLANGLHVTYIRERGLQGFYLRGFIQGWSSLQTGETAMQQEAAGLALAHGGVPANDRVVHDALTHDAVDLVLGPSFSADGPQQSFRAACFTLAKALRPRVPRGFAAMVRLAMAAHRSEPSAAQARAAFLSALLSDEARVRTPPASQALTQGTIAGYLAEHLRPHLTDVVIVADLSKRHVAGILAGSFGRWPVSHRAFIDDERPIGSWKPVQRNLTSTSRLAEVVMGQPLPSMRDARYPSLVMLNEVLGGDVDSRLVREMRYQRGISTRIQSRYVADQKRGYLVVIALCKPSETATVERAVIAQMRGLQRRAVGQATLRLARAAIEGRALLRDSDPAQLAYATLRAEVASGGVLLTAAPSFRHVSAASVLRAASLLDPSRLIEIRAEPTT